MPHLELCFDRQRELMKARMRQAVAGISKRCGDGIRPYVDWYERRISKESADERLFLVSEEKKCNITQLRITNFSR